MGKAKVLKNKLPSRKLVRKELEKLADKKGILKAKTVVVSAKTNPILRPYFTWDNNKAADKWRLQEAHNLIKSFYVVVSDTNNGPIKMAEFIHVRMDKEGYRSLNSIISTPSLRSSYASELRAEIKALGDKLSIASNPRLYQQILNAINKFLAKN